jgi:predicted nucleic acid-binding protein
LTKLVVLEPETPALIDALRDQTIVASDLVRTELRRAVLRAAPDRIAAADSLVERLLLVRLDAGLLDGAGRLEPRTLRTLDAIHVQCALLLGEELDKLITYDARQADAARSAGLRVERPA